MRKILVVVTLALVMAMLVAPCPVLAQEETPPDMPLEWIQSVWAAAKATPVALVISFFTVIAGYLSSTDPKKFKLENFVFTLVICFIVGFLTISAGWTYTQVQQWLANGFITWYIWKLSVIAAGVIAKKGIFTQQATGPPTIA